MNLKKFNKKLYEEQLSSSDNKKFKKIREDVNEYIKNQNLDELDIGGIDYLEYSKEVKAKIDSEIEESSFENPEEVRNQLYNFFEIQ